MGLFYDLHHPCINPRGGILGTGQRGIPAQILVLYRFQSDHIKLIGHAIAGDQGPRKLGCLFDIICCTTGNGMENQFFRSSSATECYDFRKSLILCNQITFIFRYLHSIAKSSTCSWYNRNFCDWHGMFTAGCY